MHPRTLKKYTGFTIVELLVVIAVIGILAAVTIVAYNGATNNAKIASLRSDLFNAVKQINLTANNNNNYPTSIDCSATPAANSVCLKSSPGNTYTGLYTNNTPNPKYFCVSMKNGNLYYYADQDRSPSPGICSTVSGLVSWWKFNGTTNDVTGNGNNPTNNGATLTTGQNGLANGAYAMAGGDINLGSPSSINNLAASGFSYSIWVERTGTSSYQWPIIMGGTDTHTFYGIRSQSYGDSMTVEYGTSPYSGSTFAAFGWSSMPLNTWHLVTITYSGGALLYYFDGNLVDQNAVTLNPNNKYFDFQSWNGSIDDARIFNRPLSATEVSWLYKMGSQ